MPELPNHKHEAFAFGIARGLSQAHSYVQAGYKHSDSAASNLAKKPEVKKRVEELRQEMMEAANAVVKSPSEENLEELTRLDLTLDWCAMQYKEIAEKAKKAGQFAPANQAIKNIQTIIELDGTSDSNNPEDGEEKFSIKAIKELGEVFSNMPDIVDVTPEEEQEVVDITMIAEALDDNT